jgi:hypothetical protein
MAEFKKMASLWKAEGKTYKLSGSIEIDGKRYKCFMFPNDKKTADTHPDYVLSVSVEEQVSKAAAAPATPAPSVNDVDF